MIATSRAVNAIRTKYKSTWFRSRLEARWAAFFDLCGWHWAYEPVDFRGWIPDFAVGPQPLFAEIKPFFAEPDFKALSDKLWNSGVDSAVAVFGADATHWIEDEDSWWASGVQIGWLWNPVVVDESSGRIDIVEKPGRVPPEDEFQELHFGITTGNDLFGLCPMYGSWTNLIWGHLGGCLRLQTEHSIYVATRHGSFC